MSRKRVPETEPMEDQTAREDRTQDAAAADPAPPRQDQAVLRDALARIEAGNTDLARDGLIEELKSAGIDLGALDGAPGGWGIVLHGIEASAATSKAALALWCSKARRAIMRGEAA